MGFKTKHGLCEWVINSLNLNNAFMSLKNQILEQFLGRIVLKGFDHLNVTLSCVNSNLNCCLSISSNDQLLMMSFDALTANLKKCTLGMDEPMFLCFDETIVGKQVVAEELSSVAAMEIRRIFAKGRKEILAKALELKVDEVKH